MRLTEEVLVLPRFPDSPDLLGHLESEIRARLPEAAHPIRFVVTRTDAEGLHCEVGTLCGRQEGPPRSIFELRRRTHENMTSFNAALIVPTGIGAEFGGHAGDGGAVARLMAGTCDTLVTHPNVVNAADLNEMPPNTLYVEGSVLSDLLLGNLALQSVRSNRVAVIIGGHADPYFVDAAVNAVNAARANMGLDCPRILTVDGSLSMRTRYAPSGRAVGDIAGVEHVCALIEEHRAALDAVALTSRIEVPDAYHTTYFDPDSADMVNPWGGVEAMLTHTISALYGIPSAHSPMMSTRKNMGLDLGVVDPRKAADTVSTTYLHSVLKGLQRSPRIVPIARNRQAPWPESGLFTVADVNCVVIPDGCVGLPTLAALEQGITVIAVRENHNRMRNRLQDLPFAPGRLVVVETYLEAVGVMVALKEGVALDTVRRPLRPQSPGGDA